MPQEAEDVQKRLGSILKTAAQFNPSKEFDARRMVEFLETKPTAARRDRVARLAGAKDDGA